MIPIQHVHPMIIHFPIVFIFCLAAFDLIATVRGKRVTGRTVFGNVSAGLAVLAAVFAVIAYYFGGMALTFAEAKGFSSEVAEIHEGLGAMVALSLTIWAVIRIFFWWRDVRLTGGLSYVIPLVAVLGVGMVTATAYYGGELVYELGVNVAKS